MSLQLPVLQTTQAQHLNTNTCLLLVIRLHLLQTLLLPIFTPASPEPTTSSSNSSDRSLYAVHPIPLSDVRALFTDTSHLSTHRTLTVVLVNGLTLPLHVFQAWPRLGGGGQG